MLPLLLCDPPRKRSALYRYRLGMSVSMSGGLRVVAERYSCYRCYFVTPLRSALSLYIPMLLMRRLLCCLQL